MWGMAVIVVEIRSLNMNDWRGRLRDDETGRPIGEEWQAMQRGALISQMSAQIPLTHLKFRDVGDLPYD